METLEKIKLLTEELSVDVTKFNKGNKSAGTRARKQAQEIKNLLQDLRKEILEERNKNDYIRDGLEDFLKQVFDRKRPVTKSDMEMFTDIYKTMERSLQL